MFRISKIQFFESNSQQYSTTNKIGTLKKDLIDGFNKADCVVLKLKNGNTDMFINAIEEIKRKNEPVKNMILINEYGKDIELTKKQILNGKYKHKIKGKL